MKIQTINQLVSVWKDIATRHYQINGFGIGDNWENGTNEKMHPVLWINPVSASMPSSDYGYKTFEIDFEIRIFDLVNKDESNENEVLSDTIDILKDIIAEFKGHPYYVNSQLNIIGDIDFEAFTEEFDEEVSGWVTEISLMTPVLTTFCGIPAIDITGFEFPSIDCPDVNVLCPVFVEDVTGVYPIVVNTAGTTKEISIVGGGLSDTFVISGSYNDVTDNLELLRNDGVTVLTDLSSVGGGVDTNTFIISGAFDNTSNNLELTLNDSTVISVNLDDLKDNTDTLVSSGAVSGTDLTLTNSDLSTVVVDVTSLVSSGGGDNISNADLTFDATYNADLNGNDWSIKNSSDTLLSVKNTGEIVIGKEAENNSTNTASKHQNTVIGNKSNIASGSINEATVIGYNNTVNTTNGLALGSNNSVNDGLSIGTDNSNTSFRGIAIGSLSSISNTGVISIGSLNQTSQFFTQMLGWRLKPLHGHVTMLGRGDSSLLKSTASKQFIVGWDSPTPTILIGANSDSFIKSTGNLSLETNTTVKGSDTSVSTTGFKVTDSTNASLLEVKNNGIINASNLPTSSTGLSSGDIWNNGGVLNIV